MPSPPNARQPPELVTTADVMEEVHRLFDAGGTSGLVIRVYGEPEGGSAEADAAFREMLESLRMYDDRFGTGTAVMVQAPTRASLSRAMKIGRASCRERVYLAV